MRKRLFPLSQFPGRASKSFTCSLSIPYLTITIYGGASCLRTHQVRLLSIASLSSYVSALLTPFSPSPMGASFPRGRFAHGKEKPPFQGRESRRAIACKRLPNWDLATWLLYIVNILPVSIYGGNIPNGFARNMYLP